MLRDDGHPLGTVWAHTAVWVNLAVSGWHSGALASPSVSHERWPIRPTVDGRGNEQKGVEFQWVGAP